jgi:hypothetical protein
MFIVEDTTILYTFVALVMLALAWKLVQTWRKM